MSNNSLKKIAVAVTIIVALSLVLFVWQVQRTVEGPVPIAWDRDVCAHCRMHISDRRFAAQVQSNNAEVFNFDDPGCLFEHLVKQNIEAQATYFRAYQEDRWLTKTSIAFIKVDSSPMGYGLAAVKRGSAGSMPYSEANAMVLNKQHQPMHFGDKDAP